MHDETEPQFVNAEEMFEELTQFHRTAGYASYYERQLRDISDNANATICRARVEPAEVCPIAEEDTESTHE